MLSYQTAWLKAHYPAPFMAAVLSSDMDSTDKVVTLIEECRELKLKVEPPNVNRSDYAFRASDERTIVYGLGAVKGVGRSALEALIEERARGGAFADLFDLCRRVDLRKLNKRVLEALIRAGCFDGLAPNRASCMATLPAALQAADQASKAVAAGQDDMFGLLGESPAATGPTVEAVTLPEWDEAERLTAEKETLGLYLTGHPIGQYEQELAAVVTGRIGELLAAAPTPAENMPQQRRRKGGGRQVIVAGLVVALRTRNTQSGARMANVTLDDRTARLEVTIFPEAFQRFRHLIAPDSLLLVEGSLDYDDYIGAQRLTAEKVLDIGEVRDAYAKRLVVDIDLARTGEGFVPVLQQILAAYREGRCPVLVRYRNRSAQAMLRLGDEWRVRPSEELIKRLGSLGGPDSVRLEY